MSDFNAQVIADFNATKGKPGGYFKNAPVLLLHSVGAKSGIERTLPLMYLREGDGPYYIFASKGGDEHNPDWFHNLVANSDAAISVGDGTTIRRVPVAARVVEGEERDRIYAHQAGLYPQFAEYEKKTSRTIPVFELTPA
ncbi:deazaflavin-dependent oxidoreductase, nitroreductase family [Devosia lucknowensis]|uniref:Deazaflavin-dependent oxidoreductase, nitroreductase family n=1 Tax=Devosia lucknowensis TaxID=1096929 RepID=A0A1Y6ENT6_9HYPH|nr:nitroreductase/quinone reductase family protein [Devosia lucknowensis]SMQ64318.1 deazaflavin-dependent oxidoreductase, nitroreductase family [Devosia lucknowensis]